MKLKLDYDGVVLEVVVTDIGEVVVTSINPPGT